MVLNTTAPITVLSKRYAVYMLVSLLDSNKYKINDFRSNIKNFSTLMDLITVLENSGLIKKSRSMGRYNTTYLELTEEGREIATLLKEANDRCTYIENHKQSNVEGVKIS